MNWSPPRGDSWLRAKEGIKSLVYDALIGYKRGHMTRVPSLVPPGSLPCPRRPCTLLDPLLLHLLHPFLDHLLYLMPLSRSEPQDEEGNEFTLFAPTIDTCTLL